MSFTSALQSSATVLRQSTAMAIVHVRLRNERTKLGAFWYVVEPVAVFGFFLLLRDAIHISIPRYPLYLFVGLILFNLFVNSTAHAARAIVNNRGVVHWIRIPLIVFPSASVFEYVFIHSIELLLFACLLIWFGQSLLVLIWYPLFLFIFTLFILGLGYILATLSVYVEDIVHIWRVFVTRLLWLGTPLFYAVEPGSFLYIANQFNPLFHFLTVARSLFVYSEAVEGATLALLCLGSLILFLLGILVFTSTQKHFIERI